MILDRKEIISLIKEYRRVQISKNGIPRGDKIWLIVRKNADGIFKFAISNDPKDTTHLELAKVSTMRWPIEQCFGDGKDYHGMSQYEHRSWVAWNRHMTMVTLGLHLLLRMRLKFQKNS
jgi:SRSO17 transposase